MQSVPTKSVTNIFWGQLWLWSYDSWIYNYLCNQYLSPLKLWVRTPFMARCTRYNFSWGTLITSTNKNDYHDIAEILLKLALNTITLILNETDSCINPTINWVAVKEIFVESNCINWTPVYCEHKCRSRGGLV